MENNPKLIEKQLPEVEFKIHLPLIELIKALKYLDAEEKEFFLENLLAALSPEYLKSIEETRRDYKEERIVYHKEVLESWQQKF